ncbi:MAG: DUF711 family protein [Candidatus Acidiferrum sp.]|jgi:uncharacterized protein
MNASAFPSRCLYVRTAILFCISILATGGFAGAQRKAAAVDPAKPKIRAITAFVNLDRTQYQPQIADAVKMLKYARTVFESRGFEVQTIRISTQPFSQYTKGLTTEQALAFFRNYDAVAEEDKFDASIGPAMLNGDDGEAQADLLAEILKNTKILNGSLVVAGEDGVRWRAVGAAARVIKKLEDTEHSQANFRFSAIAMVPPLTPFFPGSYHTGFGHQFAIALESANTVAAAFTNAPDLRVAKQKLTDALATAAFDVEAQAQRIDRDTGWAYTGIDLSPAPSKDVSIGAALESLSSQPFGSSGTLTAAATVTAAIKDIAVKRTGYSGLMLPILEDSRLSQRWSEGNVSIDALLSYSAVCGTGLDTVPLPGDISEERLDLIIGDMASLAFKWHKPLSARLLPVAGKGPGDVTEFDDPALVNAMIQPLERK